MNIIYIGDHNPNSTSAQRAQALVRLGHTVVKLNPYTYFSSILKNKWLSIFHYHTGYRFLQKKVAGWLKASLIEISEPELIWVNGGELFGPECLSVLKSIGCPVVLYNNDDPTGGRDGARFKSLIKALPYYDVCAVLRMENIAEYKAKGAKKIIRVNMSYDELIHKPFENIEQIPESLRSEVAFIGTWMKHEKRDEFLLKLVQKGVPISIWGSHWTKSPHFESLKPYYRGAAVYQRDYVAAIQGAKICLGFLSKGNRDLHTRRSVEIPFIGSVFCAERTSEHMTMYQENTEAVFWDDAEECAELCLKLLKDNALREQIRLAGMRRVRNLSVGNEDVGAKVIEVVYARNA